MARNLQAEPEPHGEREFVQPVEARLYTVENPEVDELLCRLFGAHVCGEFLFLFFFAFDAVDLVDLEDGLVEVERLADEGLEYRDLRDTEPERYRDVGADIVIVDGDAVFVAGIVIEFFVVVECPEADAEGAAVVEIPAQVVRESGLVAGLVFEWADTAVVFGIVIAFAVVPVDEFHDLVEDAVAFVFLVFFGSVCGCGLRACGRSGSRLCRRRCGSDRRVVFIGGVGRLGRLECCGFRNVFVGVHLEQGEFLAGVCDGIAALAVYMAPDLHGIGKYARHVFAQELVPEFQDAVGIGGLDGDDLVEFDKLARVVGVRLALACSFGEEAHRVLQGICAGDGVGARLRDGRRIYDCGISDGSSRVCGSCGRIRFRDLRAGVNRRGAHLLAKAGVALAVAFHGHRRDGQQATAAREGIYGLVRRHDGLRLHLCRALFCVVFAGNDFEPGEVGASLLHALVQTIFECKGAHAYRLVAVGGNFFDEFALAHLDAHVLGFCTVDDERAVASGFDLVAVCSARGSLARDAKVVAHGIGECGCRHGGGENRDCRE